MPLVFQHNGYRFFFYSNEGDPREPCHIHVRKASSVAKFWIHPITVAESFEMTSRELKELIKIIEKNKNLIEEKWYEFFSR